ncbi:hypothetical protein BAC1_01458 [uncultured bacterium]|jgi:hypothetical protein|nr:hypothetical protein BAC1_01458 [uncultured bacterium]
MNRTAEIIDLLVAVGNIAVASLLIFIVGL